MLLILVNVLYVVGHFLAYALWLRRSASLSSERSIFLFHAVSYGLLLALDLLLGSALWPESILTGLALGAGWHGIYSLTFLELWSLTQGSYSLGILDAIDRKGGTADPGELLGLAAIGASKQDGRDGDLQKLGLWRPDGRPSRTGQLVSVLLRLILWLSHGRTMN